VLVEDGRIVAVGSQAEVAPAATPEAIRRRLPVGTTLLPGLIDTHVHLAFHGGPEPAATLQAQTDDVRLTLQMVDRAQTLLSHGVTTARDLGDRSKLAVRLRDSITAGEVAGPRLLTASSPLTAKQGHCWFFGGEVEGEADIRARIRDHATHGVDAIKIMASGGESTPDSRFRMWESQFSEKELLAAVEESHEHGLPIAAHAHGAQSIADAVAAGVDSIEHGTWLVMGPEGPDWAPRDDVADQMASQGTVLCHASANDWRNLARVMGEEWAKRLVGRTAWYDSRGVQVVPGTDAGVNTFDDTVSSLVRFGDYGFPPARVLEIGTVNAAAALRLSEVTGALKVGLSADLLAVDGDPLEDLTALTRPRLVMARGQIQDAADETD
jgi:imidazolonepropionase-like amidohydrolase